MRSIAFILSLAIATTLVAQEIPNAPAVTQPDYVNVWPGFVVIPWSYMTPPLNDSTAKAYREQGINAVHVDKKMSDSDAAWIDANKFSFYVDHAAGKGILHLGDLAAGIHGTKVAAKYDAGNGLIRRPVCLHDPAALADLEGLVRKSVPAAAPHDVICYSLDDEISTGSFASPVETCWCPHCQPLFRKFALGLYGGSLDKLNAEWGTSFKTADEISPASASEFIHQAATETVDKWNFSRWADFRQFQDQTLADTLVRLTKLSNELDPRRPCGFEGGQMPSPYGGYDWSRLSRAVQWVEAYDYGDNNEIVRSLAPNVVRMKTFFSTRDKIKDSNRLWYHFVHGDRGVILWPEFAKQPWWNDKAELAKEVAYLPAIFREQTGERLGKLLAGAEFVDDGIAVYYSQPSIRAAWIMDATVHGNSWPNRSSGIDATCGSSTLGRYAWTAMLEDAGLQYNFIDAPKLAAGELKFPRYKVLILPAVHAMSDAEAAAIKKFAESGGTVVADYLPGIMDEHCKSRGDKGALDDLFQVKHDWSKGLFDGKHATFIDGEKYQEPLERRFFPCQVRKQAGLGEGWFRVELGFQGREFKEADKYRINLLNSSPVPGLLGRYREAENPVVENWDIKCLVLGFWNVAVQAPGSFNEILRWRKGGRIYLCVVKNLQAHEGDWDKLAVRAKISEKPADIQVWVAGPKSTELINERTGKKIETFQPGVKTMKSALPPDSQWSFTDTWIPCEAAIYSYPEPKIPLSP